MFDDAFIEKLAEVMAPRVAATLLPLLDRTKVTPRYLTYEQAAVYLCTTEDGIRGMVRAKRFPVHKQGASNYLDRLEIDASMQQNTVWLNLESTEPEVDGYYEVTESPGESEERILDIARTSDSPSEE